MHATIQDVIDGRRRWCLVEGEALALLREIPSGTLDALITDAPYSSGGFTRGDRSSSAKTKYSKGQLQDFGGDSRDQLGFHHWSAIWYGDALRASKAGATVVTFTDWRQKVATISAIQAGGWIWRGEVPWIKHNSRPQMGRFSNDAEYWIWGTNGASNDSEEIGCLPGHVFAASPMGDARVHLTQKPIEVMDAALKIVPVGGIVLDPFCGSGTTGVAALRRGCRFIGFERDAHYARVARERLAAAENTAAQLTERAAHDLAQGGQLTLLAGGAEPVRTLVSPEGEEPTP